jgi:hypothetical protein
VNLPPVIRDLSGLIGIECVTLLLENRMLGCDWRISITRDSDWHREWSDVIGEGATDAIMKAWGGEEIYFPNCGKAIIAERNRAMVALYDSLLASGMSTRKARRALCRRFGLSDKTVRLVVNRPPEAPGNDPSVLTHMQLDLFNVRANGD